jgi:DNA-binding NtrC family response regulator
MGHVLLVDDEPVVRQVLTRLLVRAGHEVTAVTTLAEARTNLASRLDEVVVADKNLPDGSGIELLRDDRHAPPVIITTGYASEVAARQALELGAFDFLRKPFEKLTDLSEAVARALATGRPLRPRGTTGGRIVLCMPGARGDAITDALGRADIKVRRVDGAEEISRALAVEPARAIICSESRSVVLAACVAGQQVRPKVPVTVVALRGALDEVVVALRAGACGYVVDLSPDELARRFA